MKVGPESVNHHAMYAVVWWYGEEGLEEQSFLLNLGEWVLVFDT